MEQSEFPSTPTEVVNFYFKGLIHEIDENKEHEQDLEIDRIIFEEWGELVYEVGGGWTPEEIEDWRRGSQRILRSAKEIGLTWAEKAETEGLGIGAWLDINGAKTSVSLTGTPPSVFSILSIHKISKQGRDDITLRRYQGKPDQQEPVLITSLFDPEKTNHGDLFSIRFHPNGVISKFDSTEGEFRMGGEYIGKKQTILTLNL